MTFKYLNERCPNYVNEVFDAAKESNFQLRDVFKIKMSIS